MTKILLLVIVFAAAYGLLRGYSRKSGLNAGAPPVQTAEKMVRCAHCGIHLPHDESIQSAEGFFCSPVHEQEFRKTH